MPTLPTQLEVLFATRRLIVELLHAQSLTQLNQVPAGFANNLIWNAAHCWVSFHLVIFDKNGCTSQEAESLGVPVPAPELIAAYRGGTRPAGAVDQAFVDQVCAALSAQAWTSQLDASFLAPERYTTWTSSWKVTLHSAAEALPYMLMHEGMHYGVMLAQRKLV